MREGDPASRHCESRINWRLVRLGEWRTSSKLQWVKCWQLEGEGIARRKNLRGIYSALKEVHSWLWNMTVTISFKKNNLTFAMEWKGSMKPARDEPPDEIRSYLSGVACYYEQRNPLIGVQRNGPSVRLVPHLFARAHCQVSIEKYQTVIARSKFPVVNRTNPS